MSDFPEGVQPVADSGMERFRSFKIKYIYLQDGESIEYFLRDDFGSAEVCIEIDDPDISFNINLFPEKGRNYQENISIPVTQEMVDYLQAMLNLKR